MELDGKYVIVTGGAGGIGNATVQRLLQANATVAAVDRDARGLEDVKASSPPEFRQRLMTYQANVGNFAEVARTVTDFFDRHGRVDALINNAAVLHDGSLVSIFGGELRKYPLEAWDETIATNLSGYFYFGREVAEKMLLTRTKGVIVNVSSISAAGSPGQTGYAASKAAVNALTVTWAQELAMFGVRVAGLAPGMTDTPMPRASMSENLLKKWVEKTPAQRMASPDEMASAILFVLRNDFFCGRTLELDGGLRM